MIDFLINYLKDPVTSLVFWFFILPLLIIQLQVFVKWMFGSRFTFPGNAVTSMELGKSRILLPQTRTQRLLSSRTSQQILKFVTENISKQEISSKEWELHIWFSLYNSSTEKVFMYDIHAQEYEHTGIVVPFPIGMTESRDNITLYQDNSILQGGKIYAIQSNSLLPIDLVFRISIFEPDYDGMCVFGIFVDYHYMNFGKIIKSRLSSDSLYMFQGINKFISIDEKGIKNARESRNTRWSEKKHLRHLLALLEKHISVQSNV